MKKPALLAGLLVAVPVSTMILQHRALAMELNQAINIGELVITSEYQNSDSDQESQDEGHVLATSTNEQSEPGQPAEEAAAEPEQVTVTVAKGDSLSKIAADHGTTYKRLFDANEFISDPNIINPGDIIRIPSADEVLAERPLPKPTPVQAPKQAKAKSSASARGSSSTPRPSTAPAVASGSVWDRLAACESGGNWSINTGNGYYGGLQFLPSTWRAVGGTGLPHQHSREEQIKRAEILLARSGWGQWPACTKKLGLR